MMSLSHLYTDFAAFSPGVFPFSAPEEEVVQEAQLTGFETGYQAGWDDAVKAKGEDSANLTADFVQSVQDLSFTYHEAFVKVSSGLKPLMSQFVTSVLPEVAKEGLRLQIVEQIDNLVAPHLENTVELVVSPEVAPTIEETLNERVGISFAIKQEPMLASGQVYLRVNQDEREINTEAVLAEIRDAIEAFFYESSEDLKHG